jgi:hypothetical protein
MYKTMFNEYEAYNKDGCDFSDRIYDLLNPAIKEKIDEGFSAIDIEQIIYGNVSIICTTQKALRSMALRRSKLEVENNK